MNSESAEYVLLFIFLAAQVAVFVYNISKIIRYERIIAFDTHFSLLAVSLTPELIAEAAADDFFLDRLENPVVDDEYPVVNLIVSGGRSPVLGNILSATNRYLMHNYMAAADFHLIKDIADRNIDAAEEDINQTISVPLYLGLMSTMLGIIIGLFKMPDLNLDLAAKGKDLLLNHGISMLIGGVKIAMIASFVGLGLTIACSGFIFKGSRNKVEKRKNAYFSFIQTTLLPVMNQSIGATLSSLQLNLLKFNQEFSSNLGALSGLFNNNYQSLVLQKEVLASIEEMDFIKISTFNLDMFRHVEASVKEFERFNTGMAHLNDFVETSKTLSERVTDLMKRSENFERIALTLESRLETSSQLLEFLGNHFAQLEEHKDLVNTSVGQASIFVSNLFRELQGHFKTTGDSLKLFTIDEITALKNALSDSRTSLSNLEFLKKLEELDKLSGLSQLEGLSSLAELGNLHQLEKLSELTGISKGVNTFNENAAFQTQTTSLLQEPNANIGAAIGLLEHIHNEYVESHEGGIAKKVKRWFGR